MDKTAELKKIEHELMTNKTLPLRESNLVFGEGNINCEVLFIGEAPGVNEDRLRRPFVGRAGQLLDDMIQTIGWKRTDVYITNVVKRRPPENRDPLPAEIEAYKPYLTRQIAVIDPKIIVTLGRFAMNYFLPEAKMIKDHGKVFNIEGRIVYPVYHPAAALRATSMLEVLKEDFKKLPKVVKGELTSEGVMPILADHRKVAKPDKSAKPNQQGLF